MKAQRNDKCPCGSGLKYKNCCLLKETEKKKNFGEVFTPTPLVKEMLNKLSKDSFEDAKKTFLDPACGDGQFLVEVLKRKMKKHHMILSAISTIYGVEIQEENVLKCRERLYEIATKDTEDFGVACKIGDTVLMSTNLSNAKNLIKEIIEHNIVCADSLKFNFDTWGGKGQHPMAAALINVAA